MGDHYCGDVKLPRYADQEPDDCLGSFVVEGGCWLIHQQQLWLTHERAGNIDALALPAGELMRSPSCDAGQTHYFQQFQGAGTGFLR